MAADVGPGVGANQDLKPWAYRIFERAYHEANRREKCSRTDFYAGFRAALDHFAVTAAFADEPPRDAP